MELKNKIQWKKWFRKGYDGHGYYSSEVNGCLAKHDANYSRTKMKNLLNRLIYND